MLNFTDVAIRRGPRLLFADASFSLFRGEKVGITGENGSGKSTLLALVRGELHAGCRAVSRCPSNLAMAHVSQDLDATDQPAIEFVLDGDAELRAIEARSRGRRGARRRRHASRGACTRRYAEVGGYDARAPRRAADARPGLRPPPTTSAPIRAFSGGWRVRINVARALMCRSDLLLLDEPTNHLDIDAILWLENWLRAYPGTLLLIAHDREFLDRVCDRIVNIEHGSGARLSRQLFGLRDAARRASWPSSRRCTRASSARSAHMESFVERFRAKATKARQAQSRLKALERMQRIAPAHVDSPLRVQLRRAATSCRGRCWRSTEQSAGYGDAPLLQRREPHARARRSHRAAGAQRRRQVHLHEAAGRRAAGAWAARAPRRATCSIGYFAQHHLEQLKPDGVAAARTCSAPAASARSAPTEQELRDYLAQLRLSRRSRVRAGGAVLRRREGAAGAGAGGLPAAQPAAAGRAHQPPGPRDAPGAGRGAAGIQRAPWCWCRTTGTCSTPSPTSSRRASRLRRALRRRSGGLRALARGRRRCRRLCRRHARAGRQGTVGCRRKRRAAASPGARRRARGRGCRGAATAPARGGGCPRAAGAAACRGGALRARARAAHARARRRRGRRWRRPKSTPTRPRHSCATCSRARRRSRSRSRRPRPRGWRRASGWRRRRPPGMKTLRRARWVSV